MTTITSRGEHRAEVTWEPDRLATVVTQYQGKTNRMADTAMVHVTRGVRTKDGQPDSTSLDVQFDRLGRPTTWTWHDSDPPGTRRVIREGTDPDLLGFLEQYAPEVFS